MVLLQSWMGRRAWPETDSSLSPFQGNLSHRPSNRAQKGDWRGGQCSYNDHFWIFLLKKQSAELLIICKTNSLCRTDCVLQVHILREHWELPGHQICWRLQMLQEFRFILNIDLKLQTKKQKQQCFKWLTNPIQVPQPSHLRVTGNDDSRETQFLEILPSQKGKFFMTSVTFKNASRSKIYAELLSTALHG